MIRYETEDDLFKFIAELGTTDKRFVAGSWKLLEEVEDTLSKTSELYEKSLECLGRYWKIYLSYMKVKYQRKFCRFPYYDYDLHVRFMLETEKIWWIHKEYMDFYASEGEDWSYLPRHLKLHGYD